MSDALNIPNHLLPSAVTDLFKGNGEAVDKETVAHLLAALLNLENYISLSVEAAGSSFRPTDEALQSYAAYRQEMRSVAMAMLKPIDRQRG